MLIQVKKEDSERISHITRVSRIEIGDKRFSVYWERDKDEIEVDDFLVPHIFALDLREGKFSAFRINGAGRVFSVNNQFLIKEDVYIHFDGGLMDPSYPKYLRVDTAIKFPKNTHISELIKVCLRLEVERGFSVFRPR